MKILLTGAAGQLGLEMVAQMSTSKMTVAALTHKDLDITDKRGVLNSFSHIKPDVVVNCAAYTQVDDAEIHSEDCYDLNQKGTAVLAEACQHHKSALVHISSDFVFDGKKETPYVETDPVNPLGIYGKSKALGEQEIARCLDRFIIIRTSWLYSVYGRNFVKTMIKAGLKSTTLKVVSDQFGCPTSATDLASAITRMVKHPEIFSDDIWGIYHYCGKGIVSWHQFAETIFQIADLNPMPKVIPIPTGEYPALAPRPPYSALDCTKIKRVFGIETIPWEQSLSIAVNQILSDPELYLFP